MPYQSYQRILDPVNAVAYIDTVEASFKPLKREQLAELRRIGKVERSFPKNNKRNLVGWRLIVNQLRSRTQIDELDRVIKDYGGVISRFDVAIDITDPGRRIAETIVKQAILRWRRRGRMLVFEHSQSALNMVWIDFHDRSRPYRTLALYTNRANRFSGERDCTHLELRFLRPASVRGQGVRRATDLERINPQALFSRYVKWADGSEGAARHFKTVLRNTVNHARNHLDDFDEEQRKTLARMTEHRFRRYWGFDRAQIIKDQFPKRKLKSVEAPFTIPNSLNWWERPSTPLGVKSRTYPPPSGKPSDFNGRDLRLTGKPPHHVHSPSSSPSACTSSSNPTPGNPNNSKRRVPRRQLSDATLFRLEREDRLRRSRERLALVARARSGDRGACYVLGIDPD
jgi:hypothetical protein